MAGVAATPTVVPTKGKITVRATIDAHGFENRTVHIHLLLDDKEVKAQDAALPLSAGNKVVLECDAPDRAGEVKVTVKVDPLPGERNVDDNQRGTIVTVIKGGLNVLLIDKERAWEPQLIYDALAHDPRIQVKPLWLRGSASIEADAGKLFDFDKQKYDVIIIGDVTAAQMRALQPNVLDQIGQQVDRGAGFLMIGGYASFGGDPDAPGTGDWKGTVVEQMLPVDLSVRGQVESRTLYGLVMVPTDDGLRLYSRVVGLSGGDAEAEKAAWKSMQNPLGLQGRQPSGRGGRQRRRCWRNRRKRTRQTNQPLSSVGVSGLWQAAGCWPSPATRRTAGFTTTTASRNTTASGGRWSCGWPGRTRARTSCASSPTCGRSRPATTSASASLLRSKNGQEIKDGDYEIEVIGPDGAGHDA